MLGLNFFISITDDYSGYKYILEKFGSSLAILEIVQTTQICKVALTLMCHFAIGAKVCSFLHNHFDNLYCYIIYILIY